MKPRRNLTNTQLTELAMCLENDGKFHREFISIKSASRAYRLIRSFAKRLERERLLSFFSPEHGDEREMLRAYLAGSWDINQVLDDADRARIEDRYKDFYGRDDDYEPDPDNVKVPENPTTPTPVFGDYSGIELRAVSQQADLYPYHAAMMEQLSDRLNRDRPEPVTINITNPTGREVFAEAYQIQGEIAGHMAKATFLLDKVEDALPDGFKTTTTGRWTCSEGETHTFCSAQSSLQQIPKTNLGTLPTTSEFNMTNIITIRTVTTVSTNVQENKVTTFVNGTDINSLTSAQIYCLISEAEDHVARLSKIQNKPLQLQAEIEANQKGISALVAHLDERFKAENPDYVETKAAKPRKARSAAPAPAPAETHATA